MRRFFYMMLFYAVPHFVSAQGNWIEWLDMQAELNGGLHAAYLPTRINSLVSGSSWEFSDTSVINPGMQVSASVMPIANKYFGIGWQWSRAEGYAATSSHSLRHKGISAYIGHPRLKLVYQAESINRYVNIYRIQYGTTASGGAEWFGRSPYENISRQAFGLRLTTTNTTEVELQYLRESWAGQENYAGFGLLVNTADNWQYVATFFLNHPARGLSLEAIPSGTPLPQSSPMAMLSVSKRLVFKSNYAKMAKYGL